MATTYDATALFNPATPEGGRGLFGVIKIHLDFKKLKDYLAAQPSGAASDVIQLFTAPVGLHILSAMSVLRKAEGSAFTMTVGDGSGGAAGWIASVDLNTTVGTVTATIGSDAMGATGGKVYSSADTVDAVLVTYATPKLAIVDLYFACIFYDLTAYTAYVDSGTATPS